MFRMKLKKKLTEIVEADRRCIDKRKVTKWLYDPMKFFRVLTLVKAVIPKLFNSVRSRSLKKEIYVK